MLHIIIVALKVVCPWNNQMYFKRTLEKWSLVVSHIPAIIDKPWHNAILLFEVF